MPQPSSMTADEGLKMPVEKKMLDGEVNHEAKSGVIFQRTAPVVPPARFEESTAGDWWMVYSLEEDRVTWTLRALGSTKPRFCEGMGCA